MADDAPGWVKQRYEDGVKPIKSEIRNYWLNHAFFEGRQWLYWNQDVNRLDQLPSDSDRIQATVNRMRANTRTIMANLTQRGLTFEVPPTAADDASIRAASLSAGILRDLHFGHDWETKRESNMMATLKGGTGAICVDWDTETNDSVETPLSISEMVVEPGARDAETARWWVKSQLLPPKEIQAIYKLPAPPPADATEGMTTAQNRILGTKSGGGSNADLAMVLTYYERPNHLNKKGGFKVEVDGRIVEEGPWNFPWKDRLNFAITRETLVETQWAGSTVMDDVRPLQVALNATWSNYLEHLRDAGTARLLIPASAADIVRQFTDIPGEMVEYPDGLEPPRYLEPPQVAAWVRELAPALYEAIDDVMGVHDVSRGQAPPNIESGYGISILAEKDSSPVGRLIKESAKAWTKVARMCLMLAEAQKKGKITTTVTDGQSAERMEWRGSDINGQTNALVPLDAIIPRSRAAQQAFADKAMEMGLISNVAQYATLANLPGQDDIIAAAAPQLAKARRENAAFVLHEVVVPATFDNHLVHIESHNEFRSTQQYELLSAQEREDVDTHVQAHETLAAGEAGKQRMRTEVDPALGLAPNADGSPPVDPLMPPGAPPAAPPPALPPEPEAGIAPDDVTADLLASLETLGET